MEVSVVGKSVQSFDTSLKDLTPASTIRASDVCAIRPATLQGRNDEFESPVYSTMLSHLNVSELLAKSCEGAPKYRTICWHKLTKKFHSRVSFRRKIYDLGYYTVAADAALAHDKAILALNLEAVLPKNFATVEDYQRARQTEIEQRVISKI
jgi:hypothetical protein